MLKIFKKHQLKWNRKNENNILKRIIDISLFLRERDLALRDSSQRIRDSNNRNFLSLIETLFHWDCILKEHVLKAEGLWTTSTFPP